MRALIIIISLTVAICASAGVAETYSITSQAKGKTFTCEVTRARLLKTPIWRLQDDFPPLSPRKAENAATAKFRKLLKDVKGWKCTDIVLDHPYDDDHWLYLVLFSPRALRIGENDSLQLIVLMDGTVIDPKITDAK